MNEQETERAAVVSFLRAKAVEAGASGNEDGWNEQDALEDMAKAIEAGEHITTR